MPIRYLEFEAFLGATSQGFGFKVLNLQLPGLRLRTLSLYVSEVRFRRHIEVYQDGSAGLANPPLPKGWPSGFLRLRVGKGLLQIFTGLWQESLQLSGVWV